MVEGWKKISIGEIGSFSKGKGINKKELDAFGKYPCIRYGELYGVYDSIANEIQSRTSQEVFEDAIYAKYGDILFAGSGETKEEIGTNTVIGVKAKVAIGGDIIILKIRDVDPIFLSYLLNSQRVQAEKAKRGQGDAVVHIYKSGLQEIEIFLPCKKEEQTAIAAALSDMDDLIFTTKKLIATKEAIKQGLMHELFVPGEEWESKNLHEIIDVEKGMQLSRSNFSKDGKFPVYNGGIEPSGTTDAFNTDKNEIIISEGGNSCGYVNLIKTKFWRGGHCYLVKTKLHKSFTYYLLKSNESRIMNLRVGSGLPNIQKKRLLTFHVYYPKKKEEQEAIAEIFTDCDNEIEYLNYKLQKLTQLKQGMMQELLTGRTRLVRPEKNYELEEKVLRMAKEPSNEELFASPNLDNDKEAALLAMLVGKNNLRLGRFRYQKLMYLFHRKTDNAVSGWLNKAAGPYNHDLRYGGVEDMVITKGWCINNSRDSEHPRFEKGSNYQEAKQQFLKYYAITPLNWMKRHFLFEKDDELELLATVDKARLARARNKLSANWRGVKEYIAQEPEWEDKLNKPHFSDGNLKRAVGILGRLFEYE